MQFTIYSLHTLLLALLLLGTPRPVEAAPCTGTVRVISPVIVPAQVITGTVQPAANLFVCRVDGAGLLASGANTGAATRGLTPAGLMLLVLSRWLHFAGYALGFGAIAFSLWAGAALAELPASAPRLWRLVNLGILVLLCAEPLALVAQTIGVGGSIFDIAVAGDVLASGFGLVWAQRVGVALLLWVVVGVVKDGTVRALWAVPGLGLLLAIIDATAGGRAGTFGIAAAVLHQAAMGAWIGALALLLTGWGVFDRRWPAGLLAHFGRLSAAAIGVLLITGVAMAAAQLTQPAALLASFYGFVLGAKLAAVLAAIGLLVFGWRMYHNLWRWRAALAAFVVVLGVASLLVSVPSP